MGSGRLNEEKTIVAYAKLIIKYKGFPEKDIERAIEDLRFEGQSECGKYEVVDSVVVDVLPIRSDY